MRFHHGARIEPPRRSGNKFCRSRAHDIGSVRLRPPQGNNGSHAGRFANGGQGVLSLGCICPTGCASSANKKMPTDFHQAPKAWSQIKHSILRNYLSLFLGKLGRRSVFYADGFAGPGRLADGTEGSPLIAAKLAASPPQKSRRGMLRCINVEEDKEPFENLKQFTADYVKRGLVKNIRGRFDEALPQILEDLGNALRSFLLTRLVPRGQRWKPSGASLFAPAGRKSWCAMTTRASDG